MRGERLLGRGILRKDLEMEKGRKGDEGREREGILKKEEGRKGKVRR